MLKEARRRFRKVSDQELLDDLNKGDKQALGRRAAAAAVGADDLLPEDAKSIMRVLGYTPSQYGYDKGGSKATGEALLREVYEV